MKSEFLAANQTQQFSSLVMDYLEGKAEDLVNFSLKEENILKIAEQKIAEYKHRKVLISSLQKQLSQVELTEKQKQNLEFLKHEKTVTVTTGHQLNLFTGPVFFFYKILQTIKLADEMNSKSQEIRFVPIFWMATEDHDFEEINHFWIGDKKIQWEKESGGAVGKMSTEGLGAVCDYVFSFLPKTSKSQELKEMFSDSYLEHSTLAEATRALVQKLFGEYGLLMIDGDDKELKQLMIPYFREDILQNTAHKQINKTIQKFEKRNYHVQVNPREINLFYMKSDSSRERIVLREGKFAVLNTEINFSEKEILNELEKYPEKFSPNVIMRPLYQETILPNVAYIGGGGEIAYWLELKDFFDSQKILFPMLIVRNSVLVMTEKQKNKLNKLGISSEELFLPLHQIINQNIEKNSSLDIDFELYKSNLEKMFGELLIKSESTHKSFKNMIEAQRTKQLKGLEKMSQRLIRAERKVQEDRVNRIREIYSELFPGGNMQERVENFSFFWLKWGSDFHKQIIKELEAVTFHCLIKSFS